MSVYGGNETQIKFQDMKKMRQKLAYLPWKCKLKDGTNAVIDLMKEDEIESGLAIFNHMLEGGISWPFIETEYSKEKYLSYYCGGATFVLRANIDNKDIVLGTFYVKPNWPGRASGICNGGFITNTNYRGKGIATIMGRSYLRLAKDLGYQGSVFNLVFEINKASIRIWEKLGFVRCGHIPKVAKLKGIDDLVDAYQYYFDLSNYDHLKYPLENVFIFDASQDQNKLKVPTIIAIMVVIISVIYLILAQ